MPRGKAIRREAGPDDIEFFGECDLNKNGGVASVYPAWYNETALENLRENIRVLGNRIEHSPLPPETIYAMKDELKRKKAQLDAIEESNVKLTATQETNLKNARKEMAEKIQEAMFSRSDMKRGLPYADPHEECKRMTTPCIPLPPNLAYLADACNIKMTDKHKVSRTGLEQMYQIVSRKLGGNPNVELLRKD